MIPASKKKSYTALPEGLSNQLNATLGTVSATEQAGQGSEPNAPEKNEARTEIKTVTKSAEQPKPRKTDRNGQINICVPPETKTEWKVLFAKNNVNITQGIIFAVEHLKNEIEKGEAILTVGGVITKK